MTLVKTGVKLSSWNLLSEAKELIPCSIMAGLNRDLAAIAPPVGLVGSIKRVFLIQLENSAAAMIQSKLLPKIDSKDRSLSQDRPED